jgi:hypothetical protein
MKDLIEMIANKYMIGFFILILGITYINSMQYQSYNEFMISEEKTIAINK